MAYQLLNADQRGGTASDGKPSLTVEEAAAQIDRAGLSWSAHPGEGVTITYAFRASAPQAMPNGTSGFERFDAHEIAAAEKALKSWALVSDIHFVRVDGGEGPDSAYSNDATILFANYTSGPNDTAAFAYFPGNAQFSSVEGDVWVENSTYLSSDTYINSLLVHELGHSLGLSHPSDYDSSDMGSQNLTYSKDARYHEDSEKYSVMSYFSGSTDSGVSGGPAVAPLSDDIAAIQHLYGPNTSAHLGDDVYGWNSTISDGSSFPYLYFDLMGSTLAIWDEGGTDTLNGYSLIEGDLIDLREGHFTSIFGGKGNMYIPVGVHIENAIGSIGADTIIGNDQDNSLAGSGGSDVFEGGRGSDTISGIPYGDETALYDGFAHGFQVFVTGGTGNIVDELLNDVDHVTELETIQFLDGKLSYDPFAAPAQILRLYDSFLGRAPDVGGFDSYLKFFAAGHTFQDMAANAAASPEFHDATAALSDTDYIRYVYEHSLRREPDPGGLQNYLDALHSGALTRTSMIVQAAESPEHVALTAGAVGAGLWVPDEKVEGLELLYDAAVQRQPDPTGVAGYTALLASGTSFRQIANQMAASAEFHAAHDGQTDAQYVDSLYVAEVGRHADAPGLAAYLDELAHGHTRGDLLYETAMSQEHQSHVLAFYDPLLIGA